MVIPDEKASLQDRLSQVSDCVGPLTNKKSFPRDGIWGDKKGSFKESND